MLPVNAVAIDQVNANERGKDGFTPTGDPDTKRAPHSVGSEHRSQFDEIASVLVHEPRPGASATGRRCPHASGDICHMPGEPALPNEWADPDCGRDAGTPNRDEARLGGFPGIVRRLGGLGSCGRGFRLCSGAGQRLLGRLGLGGTRLTP